MTMRHVQYDIDLADVDPNGICEDQTPAGAEAMALDGALVSGGSVTLDYARRLNITSDGIDNGITFTTVGTDSDGYALTEVITGPNATTVESAGYFKTVTSITTSGAGAGNISIGTVDEASTQTIPLQWGSPHACRVNVDVTGTIDFTVQNTFDDVQRPGYPNRSAVQNVQWIDITALATKTADTTSSASVGASALRLVVNSYSSGAEIQMTLVQPPRER